MPAALITFAVTAVRTRPGALRGQGDQGGVGECLVGRHVSGVAVAVERCAVFGAVGAGSVWLPGFCVVGRWVGHDCFTCGCCYLLVTCAPTR
eukprot:scaffold1227_cov111-Isochrysis_galbana.AAC.3